MPRKVTKFLSFLICFCFIFEQSGFAQILPLLQPTTLPPAPLLRYLSVNSANPFNYFNFLLDKGDGSLDRENLNKEAKKLINYFFLGITLPSESLWVNLRPDESGRITSNEISNTDLGRALLEQDLQLKKDVAKFIHPTNPKGKEYWEKLYAAIGKDKVKKAEITTSNRVWIVPGEAVVLETEDGAFVISAKLKVLLENNYLKLNPKDENQAISEKLMKEIILPPLTEEINNSPTYAPLRQIYQSLILAEWFKRKHKTSNNAYSYCINKGYMQGLESELPWSKQAIWQDYLKSYKNGEYKLEDSLFGLRRTYFSGGITLGLGNSVSSVISGSNNVSAAPAQLVILSGDSIENIIKQYGNKADLSENENKELLALIPSSLARVPVRNITEAVNEEIREFSLRSTPVTTFGSSVVGEEAFKDTKIDIPTLEEVASQSFRLSADKTKTTDPSKGGASSTITTIPKIEEVQATEAKTTSSIIKENDWEDLSFYRNRPLDDIIKALDGASTNALVTKDSPFLDSIMSRLTRQADTNEQAEAVKSAMKNVVDKILPSMKTTSFREEFSEFLYQYYRFRPRTYTVEKKDDISQILPSAKKLLDSSGINLLDVLSPDNKFSPLVLGTFLRASGIIMLNHFKYLQQGEFESIARMMLLGDTDKGDGSIQWKIAPDEQKTRSMDSNYVVAKSFLDEIKNTGDIRLFFMVLSHEIGHNIYYKANMQSEDFASFFNAIYSAYSKDDFSSIDEFFADWAAKDISQAMGWSQEEFFKFLGTENHVDKTTKNDNKANEGHEASRAQINLLNNAKIDIPLDSLLEAMRDILPVNAAKMTLSLEDKETLINLGNKYKEATSDRLYRSPYGDIFSEQETKQIMDIIKKIVPPKQQWLSEVIKKCLPEIPFVASDAPGYAKTTQDLVVSDAEKINLHPTQIRLFVPATASGSPMGSASSSITTLKKLSLVGSMALLLLLSHPDKINAETKDLPNDWPDSKIIEVIHNPDKTQQLLEKLIEKEYYAVLDSAPIEAKQLLNTKDLSELRQVIEPMLKKRNIDIPFYTQDDISKLVSISGTGDNDLARLEKIKEALNYLNKSEPWMFRFVMFNAEKLVYAPENGRKGIAYTKDGDRKIYYDSELNKFSDIEIASFLVEEAGHNCLEGMNLPKGGPVGETTAGHFKDITIQGSNMSPEMKLSTKKGVESEYNNYEHWGPWSDYHKKAMTGGAAKLNDHINTLIFIEGIPGKLADAINCGQKEDWRHNPELKASRIELVKEMLQEVKSKPLEAKILLASLVARNFEPLWEAGDGLYRKDIGKWLLDDASNYIPESILKPMLDKVKEINVEKLAYIPDMLPRVYGENEGMVMYKNNERFVFFNKDAAFEIIDVKNVGRPMTIEEIKFFDQTINDLLMQYPSLLEDDTDFREQYNNFIKAFQKLKTMNTAGSPMEGASSSTLSNKILENSQQEMKNKLIKMEEQLRIKPSAFSFGGVSYFPIVDHSFTKARMVLIEDSWYRAAVQYEGDLEKPEGIKIINVYVSSRVNYEAQPYINLELISSDFKSKLNNDINSAIAGFKEADIFFKHRFYNPSSERHSNIFVPYGFSKEEKEAVTDWINNNLIIKHLLAIPQTLEEVSLMSSDIFFIDYNADITAGASAHDKFIQHRGKYKKADEAFLNKNRDLEERAYRNAQGEFAHEIIHRIFPIYKNANVILQYLKAAYPSLYTSILNQDSEEGILCYIMGALTASQPYVFPLSPGDKGQIKTETVEMLVKYGLLPSIMSPKNLGYNDEYISKKFYELINSSSGSQMEREIVSSTIMKKHPELGAYYYNLTGERWLEHGGGEGVYVIGPDELSDFRIDNYVKNQKKTIKEMIKFLTPLNPDMFRFSNHDAVVGFAGTSKLKAYPANVNADLQMQKKIKQMLQEKFIDEQTFVIISHGHFLAGAATFAKTKDREGNYLFDVSVYFPKGNWSKDALYIPVTLNMQYQLWGESFQERKESGQKKAKGKVVALFGHRGSIDGEGSSGTAHINPYKLFGSPREFSRFLKENNLSKVVIITEEASAVPDKIYEIPLLRLKEGVSGKNNNDLYPYMEELSKLVPVKVTIGDMRPPLGSLAKKLVQEDSSYLNIKKDNFGSSSIEVNKGGIDLSKIELTLKDEKYMSSLNPADVKVLRAAKALNDQWDSLSLLYVHEIMLMMKDGLIKDLQNRNVLMNVMEQLRTRSFLDPQAMQFFNLIQLEKSPSEIKLALSN